MDGNIQGTVKLADGVYFFKYVSEGRSLSEKVIVVR